MIRSSFKTIILLWGIASFFAFRLASADNDLEIGDGLLRSMHTTTELSFIKQYPLALDRRNLPKDINASLKEQNRRTTMFVFESVDKREELIPISLIIASYGPFDGEDIKPGITTGVIDSSNVSTTFQLIRCRKTEAPVIVLQVSAVRFSSDSTEPTEVLTHMRTFQRVGENAWHEVESKEPANNTQLPPNP